MKTKTNCASKVHENMNEISMKDMFNRPNQEERLYNIERKLRQQTCGIVFLSILSILGVAAAILIPIFLPLGPCCNGGETPFSQPEQSGYRIEEAAVGDAPCCQHLKSEATKALVQMQMEISNLKTENGMTLSTHEIKLLELHMLMEQLQKTINKVKKEMVTERKIERKPDASSGGDALDITSDDEEMSEGSGDSKNMDDSLRPSDCFVYSRPVCPDDCIENKINARGCAVPICCGIST